LKSNSIALACALLIGCGDSGSGDCGFVDDLLPYEVGYTWTYSVTDLDSGERSTKFQQIESAPDDPTYGPVVLQITDKARGQTRSLLRKDGDQVIRFEQQDLSLTGALERTTVYDPPKLRIDESDARIAPGATFSEMYTETTTDSLGETVQMVTDEWEVLGVDVGCESALGTFSCIQLRRVRTVGGNSNKQFFFARGVGKVKEVGAKTVEDLVDCE